MHISNITWLVRNLCSKVFIINIENLSYCRQFTVKLFFDELIHLKVIKVLIAEHAKQLLNKYPLGIQVLFIHYLEKWQNG